MASFVSKAAKYIRVKKLFVNLKIFYFSCFKLAYNEVETLIFILSILMAEF